MSYSLTQATPAALQHTLGQRVHHLRLSRNMTQAEAAQRAHISERAWRNLENGRGSTVETLFRGLYALNALDLMDALMQGPKGREGVSSKRPRRPVPPRMLRALT